MKIGSFDIDHKVLVVAEIGNNHEGNFDTAVELVESAARCGVDAVKFQTVRAADLVRRSETARYERLKRFELSERQFGELSELAKRRGLLFLSTPLSVSAAVFLESMVDAFKIASGDNDFFPLLAQVARSTKPVIISTGASDLTQVDEAVLCLREQWKAAGTSGELALLHCVSSYPTPPEQANLRSIPFLIDRYSCTVGYSDHTLGIDAAVLGVALGARIIEKHFTLDKERSDFRDHQLSADPPEMTELVRRIRAAESMFGTFGKKIEACETDARIAIRRSIVAAHDLKAGARITMADLKWIRPGDGVRPGQENAFLGRLLKRNLLEDQALSPADVE